MDYFTKVKEFRKIAMQIPVALTYALTKYPNSAATMLFCNIVVALYFFT